MSTANDKQYGGDHYKGKVYQHWDFAHDLKLPYHIGCATKYPSRWRDKGGIVDLQKTIHYIEKSEELGIKGTEPTDDNVRNLSKFIGQLPETESEIVYDITIGNYGAAKDALRTLIQLNK